MTLTNRIARLAQSLTFRLILLGIIMVLAGAAARYTVATAILKTGIQELVASRQLSLANYVAQDVNGKINTRKQMLTQLAEELPLALMERPQAMEDWLALRQKLSPIFSHGLVVIPANGKGAVADYPRLAGRRDLDFNDRDWFTAARSTGQWAIGKPTIGRAAQEAVVNMAMPVKTAEGKVAAVIMGVTALNMPGFLDTLESPQISGGGSLLMFSVRDEIIVTATEKEVRLKPTPPPGVNRLHDKAMTGWRGADITVNAYGVEMLAAFASVPVANWVVVARIPTSDVFSIVTALVKTNVRSSVVSTLILSVVLVILLTYLFRPLKHSGGQMRAMAEGRIPLAKLPVVRHDEVGEMVESFNALVQQLLESQTKLAHVAHHDPLTGLPNRLSFMNRMQHSVALAERQGSHLALMFIDLDGFKLVNDTHGHTAGDEVLKLVAERLLAEVRQSDLVGRMGGDEFMLLFTDCQDPENAAAIAQKLIFSLSAPYQVGGAEVRIGACVGIALFPDNAIEMDSLVVLADTAMYDAKRSGRNGYRFAKPQN